VVAQFEISLRLESQMNQSSSPTCLSHSHNLDTSSLPTTIDVVTLERETLASDARNLDNKQFYDLCPTCLCG